MFDGKLWLVGGWFNSFEAPPRDVWSSADGRDWKLVSKSTPFKHTDLPMMLVVRRADVVHGRLVQRAAAGPLGHERSLVVARRREVGAGHARCPLGARDWPPARSCFKDKMWILGGTENYYFGDDKSLKNDVWCTDRRQAVEAGDRQRPGRRGPITPRSFTTARCGSWAAATTFPKYHAKNDVWCSTDGVQWTQVTDAAPWHERLWFSAVVYRGRIWVLGGWSNKPSRNWGDVWYSRDGKDWTQLKSEVIWKERHEHSAYVAKTRSLSPAVMPSRSPAKSGRSRCPRGGLRSRQFGNGTTKRTITMLTRRNFMGAVAAGGAVLAGGQSDKGLAAADQPVAETSPGGASDPRSTTRKRLAIVTTEWRYHSHAWHMGERFLVGYPMDGRWHRPPLDVVSAYVDQFPAERPEPRAGRRSSASPIYPTIAEALRCGGEKLAVDAVLIIGEHGNYPQKRVRPDAVPALRVLQAGDRRFQAGRPRGAGVQRQAPVVEVGVGQGDGRHVARRWDFRSWPARRCRSPGGCRRSTCPTAPRSRRCCAWPSAASTATTSTRWK